MAKKRKKKNNKIGLIKKTVLIFFILAAALLSVSTPLMFYGLDEDLSAWFKSLVKDKSADTAVNAPANIDGTLTVHFIDVGQGDCIFIDYSGEYSMLIDAGEPEYSNSVIKYLNDLGVKRLDYIIATHPHSDHIGGLAAIINTFEAGKIIAPKISEDLTPTTATYEKFLTAVQNNNLPLTRAVAGDIYELGGASFEILSPVRGDYTDLNEYSVVTVLNIGAYNFLFTGDATIKNEKEMNMPENINVLKVGHHGSAGSSSEDFLEKISAGTDGENYAVIMCGQSNTYGHPSEAAWLRLENYYRGGIFRTDRDGTIVFETDGVYLTVKS